MDVNVTLDEMRALAAELEADEYEVDSDVTMQLVERFRALDEWIGKGGFLPEAWQTEKS